MTTQLALELTLPALPTEWAHRVFAIACSAVDPIARPAYNEFTTGAVAITRKDDQRITLATDNVWAANAIRGALLDAGYATDCDAAHSSTHITAWAVRTASAALIPTLELTAHDDGPTLGGQFLLTGPHGSIEQQHGPAGHNDLVAHADHPHPGSMCGPCVEHGPQCFTRRSWPLEQRPRYLLAAGLSTWEMTDAAERLMRSLYVRHIHATRPVD